MTSAVAQTFLKTGEHGFFVLCLHIDHPVRRQTGRGEGRRKQILPGQAPQHASPGPRCYPRGKEGRRSIVDCPVPAAGHLMQRSKRQPAVRQPLVNQRNAERQNRATAPYAAVKAVQALAKRFDGGGDTSGHVLQLTFG